ncbi:MAG: SpoIIE family protein phosphatase [Gloeotrichia echinulata IR180]|jgi:sigma-B regulation protein RsbU (phosphoserine phosphatase)|nr:SpoIIE family protein phosphatase [Gloeotrichia echinulata DEX184]
MIEDPITVLLIDDQPMIAEAIRRMLLPEKDITFHYCSDPTKALKVAKSCQPTIILQDLVMPEMEGLVLVRFLRAQNAPTKYVPLIVLSSKEEPVIKAKAFALGANDYLVKLPDSAELIARIRYHSKAYVNLLKRNEAEAILQAENFRMAKELDMLHQMQKMILPTAEELKAIEDLDIACYMEPADEVGGDYYDVLHTDGITTIGIGDVTGHGLESGILMVMTQTAVRTLKEIQELDPVKFLDALNRTIYKNVRRMNSEKNLTLVILTYSQGRISISGQHEETIIVRNGGDIERVNTIDLGFPIGLDEEITDFINHTIIELDVGDGVILYTDGIPEAYNIDKKQYGLERLCEVISQNWQGSAPEIKQAIIDDVKNFIGQQKVFDDITLVVIKQLPFEQRETFASEETFDGEELLEDIDENVNKKKKLAFSRIKDSKIKNQ